MTYICAGKPLDDNATGVGVLCFRLLQPRSKLPDLSACACREVIDKLRACGAADLYAASMSAPAAAQILSALRLIQARAFPICAAAHGCLYAIDPTHCAGLPVLKQPGPQKTGCFAA